MPMNYKMYGIHTSVEEMCVSESFRLPLILFKMRIDWIDLYQMFCNNFAKCIQTSAGKYLKWMKNFYIQNSRSFSANQNFAIQLNS